MTRTSLFASFSSEPVPPPAPAPERRSGSVAAPAGARTAPPGQHERLAHLFRLSVRAGQVHPLAYLLQAYRDRETT
ncbi:MAG: hypothetical protein RLZZ584_936 [Pseudomonadota bacterium]|jgi:hypothetical protein